jgi:hypothetical protein
VGRETSEEQKVKMPRLPNVSSTGIQKCLIVVDRLSVAGNKVSADLDPGFKECYSRLYSQTWEGSRFGIRFI